MQVCYLISKNPSTYFKLQSVFSQKNNETNFAKTQRVKTVSGLLTEKLIVNLEQEALS